MPNARRSWPWSPTAAVVGRPPVMSAARQAPSRVPPQTTSSSPSNWPVPNRPPRSICSAPSRPPPRNPSIGGPPPGFSNAETPKISPPIPRTCSPQQQVADIIGQLIEIIHGDLTDETYRRAFEKLDELLAESNSLKQPILVESRNRRLRRPAVRPGVRRLASTDRPRLTQLNPSNIQKPPPPQGTQIQHTPQRNKSTYAPKMPS